CFGPTGEDPLWARGDDRWPQGGNRGQNDRTRRDEPDRRRARVVLHGLQETVEGFEVTVIGAGTRIRRGQEEGEKTPANLGVGLAGAAGWGSKGPPGGTC